MFVSRLFEKFTVTANLAVVGGRVFSVDMYVQEHAFCNLGTSIHNPVDAREEPYVQTGGATGSEAGRQGGRRPAGRQARLWDPARVGKLGERLGNLGRRLGGRKFSSPRDYLVKGPKIFALRAIWPNPLPDACQQVMVVFAARGATVR